VRVLALETSCDETAAAVVTAEGQVLSDVVRSQIEAHAPYGGVVPEIAARDHMRAIAPVVRQALDDAGLALAEVDGIAVTSQPGLVGALLVGVQAAKGLAWAARKPLVGVDHLVGHLLSVFVAEPAADAGRTRFPFVGLLVSGGHTALYQCEGPTAERIRELGATRDDAVGEAYDKMAKLVGLGYPGGPIIDRMAARGDAERARCKLAPPMAQRESLEFSFSGLKSALVRHVASPDAPKDEQELADLCAAFQRAVVRTLVSKTLRAAIRLGAERVVVAGGVAANRELRTRMAAACEARGLELRVPALRYCTDNAAMIGYAGAVRLGEGARDGLGLGPSTVTSLPRVTRKGRGKR
jgi:N6-L-threonylcarbamoyladenine synthase